MTRPFRFRVDRPPVVVLLDANVLYSKVLSDYFVHAQFQRLVAVKWSSEILDEMIRNKKAKAEKRFLDPRDREPRLAAADALRDYIERQYPNTLVEPEAEHFDRFEHLSMPDPDDRHVLAAAVAADADFLCTDNTADFPDQVMDHLGIQRVTPDYLLVSLANDQPLDMVRAHQRAVAWTPGTTHRTTLDALRRAQAPLTASRMERLLASLGDLDSRDDLAQVYASAVAERDRAEAGSLPPSNKRPGLGEQAARPPIGLGDRHRSDRQRGIGAQ